MGYGGHALTRSQAACSNSPMNTNETPNTQAADERLRLRRLEAQRRFDTLGLPRATRLSEVRLPA